VSNTPVSSVYSIGLEFVFIPCGRSLIYRRKNKGPKIDPWGTPHFLIPQLEENVPNPLYSTVTLCFLSVQ
jgi:hypothetical protein